MIPITANVSNALVRYGNAFGRKPLVGEIPTTYTDPEMFVAEIDRAIRENDPIYRPDGEGDIFPSQKRKKTSQR